MTTPLTAIENIRRLAAEGRSGCQIAAVLAELTTIIIGWLTDDARRPREQRHTSTRICDRLVAEHDYQGSYSPVQRFHLVLVA